jgi:hypothetical protein
MCQEPARVVELIKQLSLDDHAKRDEAARSLLQLQSLPDSALNPVISFLGLEAVNTLLWKEGPRQKVEFLPVVGDEVSLEVFKAAPMRYINRPLIVAGSLGGHYHAQPWLLGDAAAYKSFGVILPGLDGRGTGGSVNVHTARYIGAVLGDQLSNAGNRQESIKIRFRCIIQSANMDRAIAKRVQERGDGFGGNPLAPYHVNPLDFIEATDWQVLAPDGKTWLPWSLEDISLGFKLLSKIGKPSHPRAIDVITEEVPLPDLRADAVLREMAILQLLRLPAKDRAAAARTAQTRLRRPRSPNVETWARRACNSLANGQLSAQ